MFRQFSLPLPSSTLRSFIIKDPLKGLCEFTQHTNKHRENHFFSGIHPPFFTKNNQQINTFNTHFSSFSFLFPHQMTAEEFSLHVGKKSPVAIKQRGECPNQKLLMESVKTDNVLAVGGAPSLIGALSHSFTPSSYKSNPSSPPSLLSPSLTHLTYLVDSSQWPIENGSAWHIEEDADAEAPTTYSPIQFFYAQIRRLLRVDKVNYGDIERSGQFPWRTLDWISFIRSPQSWLSALSVAKDFQLLRIQKYFSRDSELRFVKSICDFNERFFKELHEKVGGKLFLSGQGSVIVSRNEGEVKYVENQRLALEKEGRTLTELSYKEMIKRYGFAFTGIKYAEKIHDYILSPHYRELIKEYIKGKGGRVIHGKLLTIYTEMSDYPQYDGGVAEYQSADGTSHFIPFKKILLSLGNQEIISSPSPSSPSTSLYPTICAVGCSGLGLLYTPVEYTLPRVSVFGDTNHIPILSSYEQPPIVNYEGEEEAFKGKKMKLYLIRLTAGACITPSNRGDQSGWYDSTIGVGLVNAVYNAYGPSCVIKPLMMYGCNRVVSGKGQTEWREPYKNVLVQYGAGGGGLTRAPDIGMKVKHMQGGR